jgi:hypothetical protein
VLLNLLPLSTGRTNERDCIFSALRCDSEDPAPTCAMGSDLGGSFPTSEFTTAKAAKKSPLGQYSTIHLGKCTCTPPRQLAWTAACISVRLQADLQRRTNMNAGHLGDLWDKGLPGMSRKWRVSSPGTAGFDEWLATQAEASSSMSNCGCFPVNHSGDPGPAPPAGYRNSTGCGPAGTGAAKPCAGIRPHGDHCVVGGGAENAFCTRHLVLLKPEYLPGQAQDKHRKS